MSKISGSPVEVVAQRSSAWIEMVGISDQTQKAVMRDVLGLLWGAKHPVGEAEGWIAMALVKLQERTFVTIAHPLEKVFI